MHNVYERKKNEVKEKQNSNTASSPGVDSVSYKLVKITKKSEYTRIYIISLVNT